MTDAPEFSLTDFTPLVRGGAAVPRIWLATAEPAAVTITVVAGDTSALVVDTGSSPAQGAAIREAAEAVAGVPVSHVVVTHAHYDHLFGLAGFGPEVVSVAHESVTAPDADGLIAPSESIVALRALDVGGRRVELLHPGQGHTAGDLVVVVPDADVVIVGDLVEQATPPWYGEDSWPQEWPATLDGVIGLLSEDSIVIPGHGEPVDREFVIGQRSEIAAVAYEIEQLIERGITLEDAETQGNWAHPWQHVRAGVAADWARAADRGIRGTRPTLPLA